MFNRVKELLVHEGMLSRDATKEDLCKAVVRWVDWVEGASKDMLLTH
jgi:hypothetical protein